MNAGTRSDVRLIRGAGEFWRSLTTVERSLILWGWSLGAISIVGFWWAVEEDWSWTRNSFLINLASAVTGVLFGVPAAVVGLRRLSDYSARQATTALIEKSALADANAIAGSLSDLHGGIEVGGLARRVQRYSRLLPAHPSDETVGEFVLGPSGAGLVELCESLTAGRAPQMIDYVRLVNLSESVRRLRELPEMRAVGDFVVNLPPDWSHMTALTGLARRVRDTVQDTPENRASFLAMSLADMARACEPSSTIAVTASAVVNAVNHTWSPDSG